MPSYHYLVAASKRRRRRDALTTYSLSANDNSVVEGGTVTFTLTTTNAPNGKPLYYFLENDTTTSSDFTGATSGSVIVQNNSATFNIVTNNDTITEIGETFRVFMCTGSPTGRRVVDSGLVTIQASDAGYAITQNVNSITESGTVTFTVTTSGLVDGTTLTYDLIHVSTSEDDFTGATSGTLTIASNKASFSISARADLQTEGNETFKARIKNSNGDTVLESAAITITDSSVAPRSYDVATTNYSVNEGSTVTFTISTVNVPNGTTLYYNIEHDTTTASDFTGETSGFVIVQNNRATFDINVKADLLVDGISEIFRVRVLTDSITLGLVATSPNVTISDTSISYLLTSSLESINEGQTVTFTITTTGLADGTLVPYTISGNGIFPDDIVEPLNGNFVITNNMGSVDITAAVDGINENPEVMTMTAGGTSESVTIVNAATPANSTTSIQMFKDVGAAKLYQGFSTIDRRADQASGFIYAYYGPRIEQTIKVWRVTNNGASRIAVNDPTLLLSTTDRNNLFGSQKDVKFSITSGSGYMAIGGQSDKVYVFTNSYTSWNTNYITIPIVGKLHSISFATTLQLVIFDDSGIRAFYRPNNNSTFTQEYIYATTYGGKVTMSVDGNYMAATIRDKAGITTTGQVRAWSRNSSSQGTVGTWSTHGSIFNDAEFPDFDTDIMGNIAIDNTGSTIVYNGGVFYYSLQTNSWIKASQNIFNVVLYEKRLHLSDDGNILAVGNKIFRKISNYWYNTKTFDVNPNMHCTSLSGNAKLFMFSDNGYDNATPGDIAIHRLVHT